MDETAQLLYFKYHPLYEAEKPYYSFIDKTTNVSYETAPAQTIIDIRGREKEFTLTTHGFEYRKLALPNVNWTDMEDIKSTYLGDLKKLVHDLIPQTVERCELFGIRLRNAAAFDSQMSDQLDARGVESPAMIVHVDESPEGVLEWLKRRFGEYEMAEIVTSYRVQIINIWRPLVEMIEDIPLAMCDIQTVKHSDLVPSVHVRAEYLRKNFLVKYSSEFQFYYLSKMTKEEVCAFIVFDSKATEECRIQTPPHAAFWHSERWRSDKHPRESIEVRLLVLSTLD